MNVEHILSEKGRTVVTIEPDRTLNEAVRLLASRRIGAVVVAREPESLTGILSERDIVRALAEEGVQALDSPVSRFMTGRVVTCTPRAAVDEVMEMMTRGKFRHLPVVSEGRLLGIVSIGDVVKHRVAEIEAEHKAMREYIATA